MWGLTPAHLLFILIVLLIVVGPGKLPETGAALGKALRGFKDAFEGKDDSAPNAPQQAVQPQPPSGPPAPAIPQDPAAPPPSGEPPVR